jgi:hypothetical protein
VLVGLPGAVTGHLLRSSAFFAMARADRDRIADADLSAAPTAPRKVILLNAPSAMLALSFAPTWNVLHPDPLTDFFPLQLAGRGLNCTRAGERVLLVSSAGTAFIDNRLERLLRYRDPPHVGQVFRTAAFAATALALGDGGIREVRLEFERPLEDAGYVFLAYIDGRMRPIAPPALGQTLTLSPIVPAYWFAP